MHRQYLVIFAILIIVGFMTFLKKNDNVNISITDNGYGISKTDMQKIFEPSFTTKTSGMGLGLSMIKSIITAYNGNITFSSKSNVGTTFNITFPKN